jgi:predicted metal-dependent HD superfamily phosphohydrolase
VTSRERPAHARAVLQQRWPGALAAAVPLREELLARWAEPHRHYHDVTHLLAVLDALDAVTDPGEAAPLVVTLAAWFHDAVYDGAPGTDEEASALLAETVLAGHLPASDVAEVARLVRVTTDHRPEPGDRHGALLCDADLAVLGAEPARYDRYVAAVRLDYAHVSDADWRSGRAAVLRQLLALDPLYRTERGRHLWQERAGANLRRELQTLTG